MDTIKCCVKRLAPIWHAYYDIKCAEDVYTISFITNHVINVTCAGRQKISQEWPVEWLACEYSAWIGQVAGNRTGHILADFPLISRWLNVDGGQIRMPNGLVVHAVPRTLPVCKLIEAILAYRAAVYRLPACVAKEVVAHMVPPRGHSSIMERRANGRLHCVDGPALVKYDDDMRPYHVEFCIDGMRHNVTAPAVRIGDIGRWYIWGEPMDFRTYVLARLDLLADTLPAAISAEIILHLFFWPFETGRHNTNNGKNTHWRWVDSAQIHNG
jgi:hypothetical protein